MENQPSPARHQQNQGDGGEVWVRQEALYSNYHLGEGDGHGGLLPVPAVHINNKPDWSNNTEAHFRSRLSSLKKLRKKLSNSSSTSLWLPASSSLPLFVAGGINASLQA